MKGTSDKSYKNQKVVVPFQTDPHVYIARETDSVISLIKKQNCLLNDTILPCPDISDIAKFAIYHYWSSAESVNVFQVCGTAHPDYIGHTWIDMLKIGKRMSLNLPLLEKNPGYYFESCKKVPEMQYARINGKLFISGEGNHRTAIAKVLFFFTGHSILHGVIYDEYEIDFEAKDLFEKARQAVLLGGYPVSVDAVREVVKRDDTAGWKKDYFRLKFIIKNLKYGVEKVVSKDELREFVKIAEKREGFWSRFLGRFLKNNSPFAGVLRR